MTETDSDLAFKVVAGEKSVFIGGSVVREFTPHEGKIVKADASKLVQESTRLRQLVADCEHTILARCPNHDAANPLYGCWAFVPPFPPVGEPEGHDSNRHFFVEKDDLRKWAHPEDGELDILAESGWWNFIEPMASLDPKPCDYTLLSHDRFHFQTPIEALDSPGEWFLDPRMPALRHSVTGDIDRASPRDAQSPPVLVAGAADSRIFRGHSLWANHSRFRHGPPGRRKSRRLRAAGLLSSPRCSPGLSSA